MQPPTLLWWFILPLSILLGSCGDKAENQNHDHAGVLDAVLADTPNEIPEDTKLGSEEALEGIDPDVRLLLEQTQAAIEAREDGSKDDLGSLVDQQEPSPRPITVADKEGANAVLDAITRSNQEQEAEIAKLKSFLAAKDKRIHEYRIINQDLQARLEALQQSQKTASMAPGSLVGAAESVDQLKRELANLKNDFAMRTKDWYDAQEQVRILESKIKNMDSQLRGEDLNPVITESVPLTTDLVVPPKQDPSTGGKLPPLDPMAEVSPVIPSEPSITSVGGSGRLEFQAAVTEASGKTREAFYTEFFITKNHLDDILKGADLKLADYEGIGSYAELWARVRKNEYRYPGLQRRIREALLAAVDADQGRRIRTDIDGASPIIKELSAGSYFIIGTAPLGQVGVTWSLPLAIEASSDKRVALTLNNSSWSL
ncbi:MAG: hypothetical protein CMI31_04515 [Opitutae bacterium]|nr:hypothetical protein [Opitutae bacterium]